MSVNTPVVFVTIGKSADFWPKISAALAEYIEGVQYIPVPENFDDANIKAEVGRVWREFLGLGQADVIRVNYILRTDESGLKLPQIRESIETYFQALYPAGVLSDIYCLLNDANLLDDGGSRKGVIQMLKDEKAERVYMLSNLTSMNIFIPDETTAQTIALLTLFKDCVPDLYLTGADASRYNEFFFLENCAMRRGCFLTAASLTLAVPQDALKALLIAELLKYGQNEPIEPEPPESAKILPGISVTTKAPAKNLEYLCGLAIPDVNRSDRLTRKQWLSRLFGLRLKRLLNNSEEAGSDESKIPPEIPIEGHNLYDLLRYTGESGIFEKNISQALLNIENDLRKAEEKYNLWLEEMPNATDDSAKRRLSPLVTQDLWPYELAMDYLRKHSEIEHLRAKVKAMEFQRASVNAFRHRLQGYLTMVQVAALPYEEKFRQLNEDFAAFSPKAENYFRQSFNSGYALNHRHELAELSKEMTAFLQRGKILEYTKMLEEYVDTHIMPTFNRPIMDILRDFSDGDDSKAAALGEWTLQNRHYNIRLKIGYTSLHTEANLFMPANSGDIRAEDVKKHYEGRGLGRMNLFAKTDANRVAILYHAGSFDLEDLYYNL
ncbi:MAG: hypothetical protein FWB91_04320 [Defluviitaleaceae bacterium]|nr:hypothetical protein [Defluviitaleaceae bacterium]